VTPSIVAERAVRRRFSFWPLGLDFAPQPPIFLEHPRAGIDDQPRLRGVDDHELASQIMLRA